MSAASAARAPMVESPLRIALTAPPPAGEADVEELARIAMPVSVRVVDSIAATLGAAHRRPVAITLDGAHAVILAVGPARPAPPEPVLRGGAR